MDGNRIAHTTTESFEHTQGLIISEIQKNSRTEGLRHTFSRVHNSLFPEERYVQRKLKNQLQQWENKKTLDSLVRKHPDKKPSCAHNSDNYIVHVVQPVDTLKGISLMYGVPTDVIKSENNITGDSLGGLKVLIIPKRKNKLQKSETIKLATDSLTNREYFMT